MIQNGIKITILYYIKLGQYFDYIISNFIDSLRVEHRLRDQEGVAGRAGQDGHGELHCKARGGEGGSREGGQGDI